VINVLDFIEIALRKELSMGVVYFYCDESGKYRKNPVITISGVAAIKPNLEKFTNEWVSLLNDYELGPELHMSRVMQLAQTNGPKMPANQTLDERMDALIPFADCINRNLQVGLVQAWDVKGYAHLSLEAKRSLGGSHDPYHLAFVRGLQGLARLLAEDDRISIICDDDALTAWDTYMHYRAIGNAMPELGKKLAALTFAKSEHFHPLQAADMLAFLTRREASERFWGITNDYARLFNYLTDETKPDYGITKWFSIFADEKGLIEFANEISSKLKEEKV
jgi:Protein of unknown function (DUF3800)